MRMYLVSRVYHVAAESYEDCVAQLTAASPTCQIDYESMRPMSAEEQVDHAREFIREAIRQLTAFTQKQEPRRNS